MNMLNERRREVGELEVDIKDLEDTKENLSQKLDSTSIEVKKAKRAAEAAARKSTVVDSLHQDSLGSNNTDQSNSLDLPSHLN